jgi:arginine/lysine/ornithine decarboxylase
MKEKDLLLKRLKSYGEGEWYPFHMPGHKRRVAGTIMEEAGNLFGMDITEIEGFDNLHHAEGILKASMEWAASVYGSGRTYYLVNGSSGGILSGISAVVRPGDGILVARNCHKSVYHGVILNRLNVHYVYPQIIPEMGIQGGILPENVEKSLADHRDIRAVVIVSPTYDGVVSDVERIAQIVHGYGIPLIVDEAHGAHFSFGNMGNGRFLFPESAVRKGADLVIQSLHKTLPSLTQTGVLHVGGNLVDRGRLERFLQIYQSSSPSYVFMASIEACIFEMEQRGRQRMEAFSRRLERLRRKLGGMKNLVLLDEKVLAGYALDCSRIVISCRSCILTSGKGIRKDLNPEQGILSGEMLMEFLRQQFHLELEMCGADYVVAITTVMDTEEGLERLADGLLEVDGWLERADERKTGLLERIHGRGAGECPKAEHKREPGECLRAEYKRESESRRKVEHKTEPAESPVGFPDSGEAAMGIADALDAPSHGRPVEDTAGDISAEFVYLYPPGIPILVPGERITETVVEKIAEYRKLGLPVQGMEDKDSRVLKVVGNSSRGI